MFTYFNFLRQLPLERFRYKGGGNKRKTVIKIYTKLAGFTVTPST